jgi:ABC-2 type transport system permease protein
MSAKPPATPGAIDGLSDLRMVPREVRYEQLAFWGNRMGAVFTVGFSIIFLLLACATAGASTVAFLGGIRLVDYFVPTFVAYGVMATCFTSLAISLVIRRETGLLKRLHLSPLPTWVLIASIFASTLIVVALQVVLLLAIGRVAFGVALPADIVAFVFVLLVGTISFAALGVGMSTLIPRQDAAGPVTSTVFFALLFMSGLWFPLPNDSPLSLISDVFPVRHFIEAVFAASIVLPGTSSIAWQDLLVVAGWGAAGCAVAVVRFRWAPSRS